jgi:replicative DNA helicase
MGRGTLTRTEQEAMALALKRMSAMKADIVDVDGATASDILHDIEQCDADVIMVDYLQLMEDTGPRKGATREEIIASVSRRLKRTAKKSNKIVLTASQLNDNGQLRESRAIGQDADAVFRIEKIDGKDDARTLICDKLRGGKRLWTKQLDFLGHIYKFREPIM